MKLKNQILVLTLLFSGILSAQEESIPRTKNIKGYWNMDVADYSNYLPAYSFVDSNGVGILHAFDESLTQSDTYFSLALGVDAKREGDFHEVELKKIRIGTIKRSISNSSFNEADSIELVNQTIVNCSNIELLFSYEYNFKVFKNSKKLEYFIGIGVMPSFSNNRYRESSSYVFPQSTTSVALNINAVPRIRYNVKEKMALELRSQLQVLRMGINTGFVDNPALKVEQRRITTVDFSQFSSVGIFSVLSIGASFVI